MGVSSVIGMGIVAKKNQGGQPTKFQADFVRQAFVACSESGMTDPKLAKLFNVTLATIKNWKNVHPEFLASIKEGKDIFDSENVENSLLKRALGYHYNEITKEANPDDAGKLATSKTIRRHVAGDVKAQTFWLRNRNRERWPDTKKLDGDLNVKISHEEMLEELE